MHSSDRIRFPGFVLDPQVRRLQTEAGASVPLTGKAYDTLLYLVAHRARIVGKDELLENVWRGRVVEENNLTQAISAIRKALGVGAGDHRYLVTVPGHGYRFVAPVAETPEAVAAEQADPVAAPLQPSPPRSAAPRRRRMDAWRRPALLALLLLVVAIGAWAWHWRSAVPAPRLAGDASLAVLPFRPVQPVAEDRMLALGIAETLISRIGAATTLKVRALSSSQRYLEGDVDALQAARELGADYVLEGSTQRSGDMVRVGTRLRAVGDGSLVWSESFDARIDQVFNLQDRIASALTRALQLRFAPATAQNPCDGADAQAYRAYLTGLYLINRPGPANMPSALQAFDRALGFDPTCARAYAGMAFAHRALAMTADADPQVEFPRAKAAVAKALQIKPGLAEAYASRGFIQFWSDWDWPASEASFKHAIALNPNLAEAHFGYAHLLANLGRREEAAREVREAIALDPLSPIIGVVGSGFLPPGPERDQLLEGVLQRNPEFWTAWLVRGGQALARGDPARAMPDLERATRLCGGCSQALSVLGMGRALAGDRSGAEAVLAQMQAHARRGYYPASRIAAVENALGRTDRALAFLEQAYVQRDVRMAFLKTDRNWDNLRGLPRFRALMERMRFAPDAAPAPSVAPARR